MIQRLSVLEHSDFRKIELWIVSGLYFLSLFLLISGIEKGSTSGYYAGYYVRDTVWLFNDAGIKFHFFSHYFIPRLIHYTALYSVFLLLNNILLPMLFSKKSRSLALTWLIILYIATALLNSILSTYLKAYLLVRYNDLEQAYLYLFVKGFVYTAWVFLFIGFYVAVKTYLPTLLRYIDLRYRQAKIYQECLIAGIIWVFIFIILTSQTDGDTLSVIWFLCVPIGILQYGFYLSRFIPDLKERGKGFGVYLWRSIILISLTALLLSLISLLIYRDSDAFMIPFLFNLGIHIFLTTPFCWIIYHYRLKNSSEISYLKKELGKSDANLSFLQSQINPHFLFNALNTLYGTALQENAERTGEGIQMLGDMMRFMLHENMKDKILLSRDIEYLENYIELQKLRTSRSADILIETKIETKIETQLNNFEITPMLLIPFVENAFKHGISLQSPSYIKVSLQTKEQTLYFDVQNSIHLKSDNDPEKLKSGIGLQNVKQRLALLYPGKHELIIRESANEFFIHLTLTL